jgi:hypothetical protein
MNVSNLDEGEHSFCSQEAAEEFIREYFIEITSNKFAESIEDVVPAAELIHKVAVPSTAPPGAAPVLFTRYRWVIKNEDLDLVNSILEALNNASQVEFFFDADVADARELMAAAVGIFSALFRLMRNVLKKGCALSPKAYAVLITLKTSGPLSNEALLARLQKSEKEAEWSAESLKNTLESLKAMPMRNGSVRSLVAQDDQLRWLTADI